MLDAPVFFRSTLDDTQVLDDQFEDFQKALLIIPLIGLPLPRKSSTGHYPTLGQMVQQYSGLASYRAVHLIVTWIMSHSLNDVRQAVTTSYLYDRLVQDVTSRPHN